MGWALPGQKSFLSRNDKFGCILTHFLTDRKHGQALTRILRFNRGIKLNKNFHKFTVRPKGQRRLQHRPLNTPLKKGTCAAFSYDAVVAYILCVTGIGIKQKREDSIEWDGGSSSLSVFLS